MKKLNKIFMALVAISITVTLCFANSNLRLQAADVVTDDSGVSTFKANDVQSEDIYGVHHEVVTGVATTNGGNYEQYINEFEMKTDGVSSKLVTWAVQSNVSHYKRATIIAAAKDYEDKHPGWIVVGGINADQYFFGYGHDITKSGAARYQTSPYYPMISDGELRFTTTQAYNNSTSIIGFTNDGTTDNFKYSNGAGGYRLSVIDENGNKISSYTVDKINQPAGSGETSVWIAPNSNFGNDLSATKNVSAGTNTLFVVSNAELAYMGNSVDYDYHAEDYRPDEVGCTPFNPVDSPFGRGTIDKKGVESFVVDNGQIVVETSNTEVLSALDINVRIRVEQLFANEELNECEEGIGFHVCHRINGVDQTISSGNTYDGQHYSRSLFGRKADGTYVLITADMVNVKATYGIDSKGLNFTEANAVAKYFGLSEMYQQDGGGSVTAMTRQADGSFKVTNFPKDSGNPNNPREDFSFLFFVVRDAGCNFDANQTTYHSITLVDTNSASDIQNIKVTIDGKTMDYKNGLVIDGLKENTEYKLHFDYEIVTDNGVLNRSFETFETTKEFTRPSNPVVVSSVSKNEVTFVVADTIDSSDIDQINIMVGVDPHNMGSNKEFKVDGLLDDQEYNVTITYRYHDKTTNQYYNGSIDNLTIHTLSYNLPSIVTFEEKSKDTNKIVISYKYQDDDDCVKEAYILVNGEKHSLSKASGRETFEDLDFINNDYTFQLVVDYGDGKLQSQVIQYEAEGEITPTPTPTPGPSDEPAKKGKCGKKNATLIISLISLSSVIGFMLKKRH